MGVPGVPAMFTDKFCGCIDLDVGLKFLSIIYAVFWVFYAAVELMTDWTYVDMLHMLLPDVVSHYVAAGWCVISAICYILVIVGIQINNRSLILPAVLVSLGNIAICLLQIGIGWIVQALLMDAITFTGIRNGSSIAELHHHHWDFQRHRWRDLCCYTCLLHTLSQGAL